MRNVPKLRFKEFSEEWEEKKLGEVLKIGNGKDYKNLEQGEIPVYGTGGLITKVNDWLYDGESVGIGRKGTINKPMFLTGKFWTVDTLFYTYNFNNSIPKFIYYIFNNIDWLSYNEATGVPSLSKSTILKIKSFFPNLQEQQKIADFLSSVDKKISITEEKLGLFKDYKKGIMQKIFNQELRFKDSNGNNYPEWEEKRLGDVFSFKQGYQIPFKEQIKTKEKGYVRYLYISDFFSDKNLLYVKDDGKEKIIETDIIVANTGNTAGSFYRGKSGILSNNMFNIQNDEKVVTNDFLFQFLGTSLYSNQLKTFFNSSGQPHLGHKNMSMIIINYPVSFEEQQKIANFLSSIDNKIDNLTSELEDLKEFKKGLLQQMFV